MKKSKLFLGLTGALVMLVCSFFLAFYTIRDYYIAQSGRKVQGRVIGNSAVCKEWNKSVAVEFAEKQFDIKIYGPECRAAEFASNRLVDLRVTNDGDTAVLESNRYVFRVIFMSVILLLSLLVNVLMFNQYRFWKRVNRQVFLSDRTGAA